jgi:hypothetical protein
MSKGTRGFVGSMRILLMALVMATAPASSIPAFALGDSGDGTAGSPYKISTCTQLQSIDGTVSTGKHYLLTNDIDCTATKTWNVTSGIAAGYKPIADFRGTFDGGKHSIIGLYINRPGTSQVGIFQDATAATIKNITLDSSSRIISGTRTGSFVGSAVNTQLTSLHSTARITGSDLSGGIVGIIEGTLVTTNMHISKSSYGGTLDAIDGSSGGISGGAIKEWTITDSYSDGNISGVNVGGLIGYSIDTCGSITNSYVAGTLTNAQLDTLGGFIGVSYYSCLYMTDPMDPMTTVVRDLNVTSSFAAPVITTVAPSKAGGIFGYANSLPLVISNTYYASNTTGLDCYWESSGPTTDPGCIAYDSSVTPQKFKGTSTGTVVGAWDFTNTWHVSPNSFPRLAADTDGDGTNDSIETAAPNNGDANNDGVKDIYQSYVASFVDPSTKAYAVLQVPATCMVKLATSAAESSNASQDIAFEYPGGMTHFIASCITIGSTIAVTQYTYEVNGSNLVVRNYNPINKSYMTVPGASVTNVSIAGKAAAKFTYPIADGGPLDEDDSANGTIVDPIGLAKAVISAPNTGYGSSANHSN